MAKRKQIDVIVRVSLPADRSAAWARRELRHLVNDGVGYFTNAGDDDGIKARAVRPMPRQRY